LNASPDVARQIESFPPLWPQAQTRRTPIEGILATNADLDHTLGLFVLREGGCLTIYAPPAIRESISSSLGVDAVLSHYCGVRFVEPPADEQPLRYSDGTPSGLLFCAFAVPGKPPRYATRLPEKSSVHCVGYRIIDSVSGKSLVLLPDVATVDNTMMSELRKANTILFDGTFWSDDEMSAMGVGAATASAMGHLPVGGESGSFRILQSMPATRKIYVHINNTNPMLIDDSLERAEVEAAGVIVGYDGMQFEV